MSVNGTTRRRLAIEIVDATAQATLDVLIRAGWLNVVDLPEREGSDGGCCAVCGAPGAAAAAAADDEDIGVLCLRCTRIAERLERSFEEAARRARREFRDQLPRMILDLQAGGEEPVFYRGFE